MGRKGARKDPEGAGLPTTFTEDFSANANSLQGEVTDLPGTCLVQLTAEINCHISSEADCLGDFVAITETEWLSTSAAWNWVTLSCEVLSQALSGLLQDPWSAQSARP